MRNRMLAFSIAAGLALSVGSALAGQHELGIVHGVSQSHLAPPATRRASSTHSAAVGMGYQRGPGWSVAHVKRMARKARNQHRNRLAHRGHKS